MNESFAFHGYSMNNQLMCIINGGDILQVDYISGNQKLIGKTEEAYRELEQTTKEYYDKLVELGVIVPPKDPEKAMEEMQKAMVDMANLIKDLSREVKEMKENGPKLDTDHREQDVSQYQHPKRGGKGPAGHTGDP